MSRRFGRNQKRAMRKEILDANADLSAAKLALEASERDKKAIIRQLDDAEARAFRKFMSDPKRYEDICARLAHEVGIVAGEKLKPYSEKIMREAARYRPPVTFDARPDYAERATVITVEWPSVRYNYLVMG